LEKLNQVIAVEKGIKNRVIADLDKIDKVMQKPALFDGFAKNYRKKADDDEDVPPQKQNVQVKVKETLRAVSERLSHLFDVTAQKDFANCVAKADVVVDGSSIIKDAPATYLLFLEKQLTDLHTLAGRIPVLDPAEVWTWDSTQGMYRTEPTLTSRTRKVQKALVLYPATDKHPAQTAQITEDVTVGTWELTKFSGAMPEGDKKGLLIKIEKLGAAVKYARENANTADAPRQTVGTQVLDWLFG
jgi:hypothetical protein